MTEPREGAQSEDVRQRAKSALFVEGSGGKSFDSEVLTELLESRIAVRRLGSSRHIYRAAEALSKHHPEYYFLIDRDHHADDFVESCWSNFPNPETHNLLVWRRRELENYFLIPEYLERSQYLSVTADALRSTILDACRKRLFYDAANAVIVRIREDMKQNWITLFDQVEAFKDRTVALRLLNERPEFAQQMQSVKSQTSAEQIQIRFNEVLQQLTGGSDDAIEYAKGRWIEMLRGKEILPTIINRCFKVKDLEGNVIQGTNALRFIAMELIRLPLEIQPADFQELKRLVFDRLKKL